MDIEVYSMIHKKYVVRAEKDVFETHVNGPLEVYGENIIVVAKGWMHEFCGLGLLHKRLRCFWLTAKGRIELKEEDLDFKMRFPSVMDVSFYGLLDLVELHIVASLQICDSEGSQLFQSPLFISRSLKEVSYLLFIQNPFRLPSFESEKYGRTVCSDDYEYVVQQFEAPTKAFSACCQINLDILKARQSPEYPLNPVKWDRPRLVTFSSAYKLQNGERPPKLKLLPRELTVPTEEDVHTFYLMFSAAK